MSGDQSASPSLCPPIRKRRKTYTRFSDREHRMLMHGVAIYGPGKWKTILDSFDGWDGNRDTVALKDRWRTLCRRRERERANELEAESNALLACTGRVPYFEQGPNFAVAHSLVEQEYHSPKQYPYPVEKNIVAPTFSHNQYRRHAKLETVRVEPVAALHQVPAARDFYSRSGQDHSRAKMSLDRILN